ncbi:MAG: isocitrate/isopropylmalate dehydrogenase family protein [Candidatus Electryonea clarkiae]|nr:isocitrate/isopropylmalate dehydrogenase family protein [Candidatus Electryonea clarkiae]MDP8285590.1 isocitrate/isopropylmalate dehydrogenase family protein [Candidatus Electryonea clarkiae]
MSEHRIAWLPGDGVGNDVMDCARLVLDALNFEAKYVKGDIGWEFWKHEGNALPDRTLDMLKTTECALFGAITSKPRDEAAEELDPEIRDKGYVYFSPIVRLRQEKSLHTNMRPCKAYPGNPLNYKEGIDLVIFRENTEGLYVGVEFHPMPDEVIETLAKYQPKAKRFLDIPRNDVAMSSRIMTRAGCTNIVEKAFEFARKYGRKSVTVVDKPNVLRETGGMMIRSAREVAKNYPEINMWETNIDAQAMWLLKNPFDYDILVAENMFGDILSDLAAQLVGGLGFAASGNIGDNYAVFEPTHGSAPKYAGQYKVNPIAMLLSTRLMLDWLGEYELATKLEASIAKTIAEGKSRTYDMGGSNTSLEVAEEIARNL